MIDTHCHLTDPRLAAQLDAVLARAAAAGVRRMITIGTTPADAAAAVAVCRGRDFLRCAVGVHPNHAHEVDPNDLPAYRTFHANPAVVAVGEIGLDYHHRFAPVPRQRATFEAQLALAAELDKPVVIHGRDATDDVLAILRSFPAVRAVFHCFTGTPAEARAILDAGYFVGFTGAVTYKKNDALREALRLCPRDRVLIETDAPYLSPEPVRKQKTNEPAFVAHVADCVAREWSVDVAEVDRVTTANAVALFGWGR
ncbi:MAG: magnesium-dependent deoxyribonuclease [Phycisphaerales bacterium]|nr:magnesium-dependent deoxyribonuclease [Phycisphaerales bacterium]